MKPLDVLKKYEDNPGEGDPNNHGDLWAAINSTRTRVAVVDERIRVALMFGLPMFGFLVAVQLVCLGVLLQ